ncbi:hypothetical protein E2C01_045711 [Portunus trituberculatus]|uniref:Uncharacterized protein n=1 Tax=Portunus trituberculatus TaxID=210409 RepID=A0A5B7G2S5_PORTR|nr:hypothetical protein [Portunus trituberculatus]
MCLSSLCAECECQECCVSRKTACFNSCRDSRVGGGGWLQVTPPKHLRHLHSGPVPDLGPLQLHLSQECASCLLHGPQVVVV